MAVRTSSSEDDQPIEQRFSKQILCMQTAPYNQWWLACMDQRKDQQKIQPRASFRQRSWSSTGEKPAKINRISNVTSRHLFQARQMTLRLLILSRLCGPR